MQAFIATHTSFAREQSPRIQRCCLCCTFSAAIAREQLQGLERFSFKERTDLTAFDVKSLPMEVTMLMMMEMRKGELQNGNAATPLDDTVG